MKPHDLLKYYGSRAAIARAFGVKPPSVTGWFTRDRVPPRRQVQAKRLTRGVLKVSRGIYG
jgi:DNA-binding transcriptional regulator YdaS (Cro superfamily)